MDKKAAEEELRKAKEATGRALFESGNWRTVDDADEEDEDGDGDGDGDGDDGVWNLAKMRKETEMLRAKKEEERLAAEFGGSIDHSVYGGMAAAAADADTDANTDDAAPDAPDLGSDLGSDDTEVQRNAESEPVQTDEPPS